MPAIRSSTQTLRRSPRKHQSVLKRVPPPSTPRTINANRFPNDLQKKVTQVLEFFELEVTRAREDKQAAEDARVAAQKAEADAKEAEEIMRRKVRKFNAVHARAVQCRTCRNCMDRPFTLVECGHTFCFGCLRGWFHKCLLNQVGWKDIPAHLKEKPVTAAKLKELHDKKYIYIPWYTCPEVTCQTFVERKPMEVDAAKHMIGAVNAIFGAPAGQVDSALLLQHGNIWADVFYEDDNQ